MSIITASGSMLLFFALLICAPLTCTRPTLTAHQGIWGMGGGGLGAGV